MAKPRRGAKLDVLVREEIFCHSRAEGEGYVYVAWEEPRTGFVKVGRTGDPDARHENLAS